MATFWAKNGSAWLFSILSAQNISIVHPTWFYPSSGIKNKSPESQYFGQFWLIFFTIDSVHAH